MMKTDDNTASRPAPSTRYQELLKQYQEMHGETPPDDPAAKLGVFAGNKRHLSRIRKLLKATGSESVLDYGSGKGQQYQRENFWIGLVKASSVKDYWGARDITCYDPAYKPYSNLPTGHFDAVICTDVLEHVPEDDVDWVLAELFSFADKMV